VRRSGSVSTREETLDGRLDRREPRLAPGGRDVDVIPSHQVVRPPALVEEQAAEVEIRHALARAEARGRDMHLVESDAPRVLCVWPGGERTADDDVRARLVLQQRLDDRRETGRDLGPRVASAHVVDSDREDHELGVDFCECAVLDPVEQMLGPVAAQPETQRAT